MLDKLKQLAAILDKLGDVDAVALEYDWEHGWLCGFKNGDQWVICVSGWHSEPQLAVDDCFSRSKEINVE